jgi:hypothetical protein
MSRVIGVSTWLFVVALLAAGLAAISGMPYWWAFLIVAGAILINGWIATLEDDLPGGFNNPRGTSTPRYAVITGWIVRGLGVLLALLCVLVLGLYFFDRR